ncbi:MAG TPA: glycosyltransferase family 2 protein [Rhizomicrobium sp.]|nr:glycosyltransferase family 2 protein [Rhizomicrobium sp.]
MSVTPFPNAPRGTAPTPGVSPILSVIVPTFNEAQNIAELVSRLERALDGIPWEAIIVDDNSPDGTSAVAKAVAAKNPRVRCLRRLGRRGLAGACLEGILSSSAPYVAVIDGDLQHDEALLPQMLKRLTDGEADLVVGSRYIEGTRSEGLGGARSTYSHAATGLAQKLLGTRLSDPMSGFFMARRECVEQVAGRLSPIGFKILLDLVLTSQGHLRVVEEPYTFRERHAGESKFDLRIGLEFLGLLLAKLTGGVVDTRFLLFGLVGAIGLIVNLVALKIGLNYHLSFPVAQSVGTFVALFSNFVLNNATTYRDRRLRGLQFVTGFIGFCVICLAGIVSNVGIATWLYSERPVWWVAGAAGSVMGALWNYLMSSQFVWRTR